MCVVCVVDRTSDASVRTRSTTQSSLNENGEATPLSGGGENAYLMQLRQQRKMSFKIERAEEDEHKIKAMADLLLYSSPKHGTPFFINDRRDERWIRLVPEGALV
jgi:hypothetical protein